MSAGASADQLEPAGEEPPSDDHPLTLQTLDRVAVSRVIKCVELSDVRLRHSHSEINVLSVPEDWHENAYLLWRTALLYREGAHFVAEAGFLLRYFEGFNPQDQPEMPSGDDAPNAEIDVMVDFELFYELEEEFESTISEGDLEQFVFLNATSNAWGYMREFMQSTTARMGVPVFTAPVLRVPAMPATPPEQ